MKKNLNRDEEKIEEERYFRIFEYMEKTFGKLSKKSIWQLNEEDDEERNDVYIYETLLYPSKSTPPTPN